VVVDLTEESAHHQRIPRHGNVYIPGMTIIGAIPAPTLASIRAFSSSCSPKLNLVKVTMASDRELGRLGSADGTLKIQG
jgi:hypothetical protein